MLKTFALSKTVQTPACATLLSLSLLSACAKPEGPTPTLSVPSSMLTCSAQPDSSNVSSDAQLAEYLLLLADAGEDCRQRLAAVRSLAKQH